ncbi:MotA/TolQ/ExbB proton channel family protein [Cerasicoccus arenae]|uniref:Flagellar motor protein MotA n=1 Tax=Cerasicoccus arenae TaxID=424488 RepID=A0A8J3GEQ2_9BACT|nr:MotA/TolQ/ExbB proton channel family protein [Cerasicoccus arenae]MBK1859475.1 MotA/TolQ/ExbB proton channel family protein [Cerasicoccus arenae]GHC10934.1 flagellar motor protein MotA [Cerasicoccus arenae]
MNYLDLSLIEKGGPIMWPLLALSLLGFVFFVERALYLHRGQIPASAFVDGIKNLVRKQRILEALTVCEETPGPTAAIVKAALMNFDQPEAKIRSTVQEAAIIEIPALERRIGTIAAIAKASPILGLLGTVVALMQAFSVMQAEGPYANASLFSGEIAEALITSATGLAIAVMAYLAHHFLYGRVRALVHDMEWVANDIMQFLLLELPDELAAASEYASSETGIEAPENLEVDDTTPADKAS